MQKRLANLGYSILLFVKNECAVKYFQGKEKRVNEYIKALKMYVEFTGRSRRKNYWMFMLVNIVISVVLQVVENLLFGSSYLGWLYSLALFLPSLGLGVRRLHDISKSGWFLLLGFIPLIGAIILIVFAAQDSKPGDNQYGPNPKGL